MLRISRKQSTSKLCLRVDESPRTLVLSRRRHDAVFLVPSFSSLTCPPNLQAGDPCEASSCSRCPSLMAIPVLGRSVRATTSSNCYSKLRSSPNSISQLHTHCFLSWRISEISCYLDGTTGRMVRSPPPIRVTSLLPRDFSLLSKNAWSDSRIGSQIGPRSF